MNADTNVEKPMNDSCVSKRFSTENELFFFSYILGNTLAHHSQT